MSQLRQKQSEIESRDIRTCVVTFDSQTMAAAYVSKLNLEFPMLLDPERQLYAWYGMPRAGWWALSSPLVIWRYILLILRGFNPGKMGKDIKQLGGNVLIDPAGIIRMNHVSDDPHDRPSIEEVFFDRRRFRQKSWG